jgi:hypothetical protein
MVTYLLSDAAAMVTGSVIDFDQTVAGPYGEPVASAALPHRGTNLPADGREIRPSTRGEEAVA